MTAGRALEREAFAEQTACKSTSRVTFLHLHVYKFIHDELRLYDKSRHCKILLNKALNR